MEMVFNKMMAKSRLDSARLAACLELYRCTQRTLKQDFIRRTTYQKYQPVYFDESDLR